MATQHSSQTFSVEQPQRVSSSAITPRSCTAQADASIPPIGVSAFSSRFVVRLVNRKHLTAYLLDYTQNGIRRTFDLTRAKLFSDVQVAQRIAAFFFAEVIRVVTDGNSVRLALLEPRLIPERRTTEEKKQTGAEMGGVCEDTSPVSLQDGKRLFFELLSTYLGVEVFGIQAGFKHCPDSYLIKGPFGTTLAVSTEIMRLERSAALAMLEEKISKKKQAFELVEV